MARRKNRLPRQLPEDGCLQWLVRVGADTVARLCSGIMVPVRYIMEMLRQRLLHGEPEPRPIGPIPITDEAADQQRAPGSGVLQSRGRGRNPNNYYAIKPERLDPHRHRSPPAPGPTNPMTDEAEGSHTATAGTVRSFLAQSLYLRRFLFVIMKHISSHLQAAAYCSYAAVFLAPAILRSSAYSFSRVLQPVSCHFSSS